MKVNMSKLSFNDIEKMFPSKSGNVYTNKLLSTTRSGDEIIMEGDEIVVITEEQLTKIKGKEIL